MIAKTIREQTIKAAVEAAKASIAREKVYAEEKAKILAELDRQTALLKETQFSV